MTTDQSPFNLDDVVINEELARRPSRAPNYFAENSALIELAQTTGSAPQMILQKFAETALKFCDAEIAGLGLLAEDNGVEVFRWEVFVNRGGDSSNGTTPGEESACGDTIDSNTTKPSVAEALLIPFDVEHKPIGALWIVAHDSARKFDREDERVIKALAQFASAAWQTSKARVGAAAAGPAQPQRTLASTAANETIAAINQPVQTYRRAATAQS